MEKSLIQKNNKLAILVLTTEAEIYSDLTKRTIEYYLNNCESNYTFDLIISVDHFTDKVSRIYKWVKYLKTKKYVNNVKLISTNIPKDKNIYYFGYLPEDCSLEKFCYGSSHGVNYHFFKTFDIISEFEYENVLLLEHDTKPMESDWYDVCFNFVNETKKFVMAGSKYKGILKKKNRKKYWGGHLNGVAIYKNNKNLKAILKQTSLFLQTELKNDKDNLYHGFMNYDVAIFLFLKSINKTDLLINTNFITNVSDPQNEDVTVDDVMKKYPHTKILHKKHLYDE